MLYERVETISGHKYPLNRPQNGVRRGMYNLWTFTVMQSVLPLLPDLVLFIEGSVFATTGLGFIAVVIDLLFEFKTCPDYQNYPRLLLI